MDYKIYFHSLADEKFSSEELLLLELADLTTDEEGRHMRLNDMERFLKRIYGDDSEVY